MQEFVMKSNGTAYIIYGDGTKVNYYDQLRKSYPTNAQTVYSDRLYQWDYEKFNQLSLEVFGDDGQSFYGRRKSDIEKFLSLYIGKDIELLCSEKLENVSNGYPYWRFDYVEKGNA